MTDHAPRPTTGSAGARGTRPDLDVLAIVAALQDQLDDLTAAVEAQQTTIDTLRHALAEHLDTPPRAGHEQTSHEEQTGREEKAR